MRSMGHADEICIADANFPAASNARRLVRAEGIAATRLVHAIASIMPIDDFVPSAAIRMTVTDKPEEVPDIIVEFAAILAAAGYLGPIEPIERFEFYQRASSAYAIVASGEERLWGNIRCNCKRSTAPARGIWAWTYPCFSGWQGSLLPGR